jgi:hypothetical protein
MPAHPGDYTVFPVDEFNVDGLVTGADRDPATGNVSLVGYKDFVSFLWLLFDYPGNRFFAGNKRRIELPDFVYVQTEGVTFYNGDLLLISCEESSVPPGVYQLNTASWTGSSEPGRNRGPEGSIRLEEMQSGKINQFIFSVLSLPESILKIEIYDQDWIKQENEPARIFYDMRDSTLSLDMHAFPRGTYFLRLISGEEQHVVKIFVE